MRDFEKAAETREAISASKDANFIAKYAKPSAPWAYRYRALGNVCCPIESLKSSLIRGKYFDIELMHQAKNTLAKIENNTRGI